MITRMNVLKAWVSARLNVTSERGANLVEYVFLLVFIALVVVVAVTALGGRVTSKFEDASTELG